MSCDAFNSEAAKELLHGKVIYFFGDSNVRALYKDLLWLLEDGTIIPQSRLKCKNEPSHANDSLISKSKLHGGRTYQEIRLYAEDPYVVFQFVTRLYHPAFINTIKNLKVKPDVVVINSCLWDLSRWGSNGVVQFKDNLEKTFRLLKQHIPSARIIWLTTYPPSFKSVGGFLSREIDFLRSMLPWHILFANKYSSQLAKSFDIDVLDLHYNFRFLMNHHAKDGIHWSPRAMRYSVNMLLTHIALTSNATLPGIFALDRDFLYGSGMVTAKSDGTNATKKGKSKKAKNKRNKTQPLASRNVNVCQNRSNQPPSDFANVSYENQQQPRDVSNYSNLNDGLYTSFDTAYNANSSVNSFLMETPFVNDFNNGNKRTQKYKSYDRKYKYRDKKPYMRN